MRAINGFLSWTRSQGEGGEARGRLPSMRKQVLDTLSREEIQRMEDAADSARDRLIVRLLADTGLRLGELLALRADDVRVEGGKNVLKVRGKGDKERLVPLSLAWRRLKASPPAGTAVGGAPSSDLRPPRASPTERERTPAATGCSSPCAAAGTAAALCGRPGQPSSR